MDTPLLKRFASHYVWAIDKGNYNYPCYSQQFFSSCSRQKERRSTATQKHTCSYIYVQLSTKWHTKKSSFEGPGRVRTLRQSRCEIVYVRMSIQDELHTYLRSILQVYRRAGVHSCRSRAQLPLTRLSVPKPISPPSIGSSSASIPLQPYGRLFAAG